MKWNAADDPGIVRRRVRVIGQWKSQKIYRPPIAADYNRYVHGWCGPNSGYSQSIVFTSWRDTKFPTMVKAKERETCYCLSKSLWEPLLPETRQPKGKDKICPWKIVWQMWAHTYPSRVKRIVIDVLWEKKYTRAKKNGETFKRQKTN